MVNTTTTAQPGVTVTATVYSLDNKALLQHEEKKDVAANAVTAGFKLDLGPLMGTNVVLVKLELREFGGTGWFPTICIGWEPPALRTGN